MADSIEITEFESGLRVSVHVTPGAKRTVVGGRHGRALRVSVAAAPEKGKANKAVAEAICSSLNLKRFQCEVVTGLTSRSKTVQIDVDSPAEFKSQLEQLADRIA